MQVKKTILKAGIAFLLILAAFTFFAGTIKNSMLPKVRVVAPFEGQLTRSLMIYDYEYIRDGISQIVAEGAWTVSEVFIEEGDVVTEGDILYSIDIGSYNAQLLRLLASAQALDNTLKDGELSDEDRRIIELNSYAAWREYRLLRDSFPSSGDVPAAVAGTVMSVNIEKFDVLRAGQSVAEIAEAESRLSLKFELSPTENSVYRDSNAVKLCFLTPDGVRTADAAVMEKEKRDNSYFWNVEIPGEVKEADVIQYLELQRKSAQYQCIIPTSCIQSSMEAGDFIYIVYEERRGQSVVNVIYTSSVLILERGELYTAVEPLYGPSGLKIVHFSTKPIAYGSEVLIL